MLRNIIKTLLLGKNYDSSVNIEQDFPRSRNFDILILGGTTAHKMHGNYRYFGDKEEKEKVLSLCYPYRTTEINREILRRYHSLLRPGGKIVFYQDIREDARVGSQTCYANISLLHKIQRVNLELEYSKLDVLRYFLDNHRCSYLARKYARRITSKDRDDTPSSHQLSQVGELEDFCRERGYDIEIISLG